MLAPINICHGSMTIIEIDIFNIFINYNVTEVNKSLNNINPQFTVY